MDEFNPYAAPKAEVLATDADALRIRYEHLRTESHLKALALLLIILAVTGITQSWLMKQLQAKDFGVLVGIESISWFEFATAMMSACAGAGLLWLRNWAAMLAAAVSILLMAVNVLQLPGSLLGIVFHAVILRFLFLEKSRRVLSAPYKRVIRQTPLVESPTASWIKPVGALFVLGLAIMYWVVRQ